jgi:hypothetical protein
VFGGHVSWLTRLFADTNAPHFLAGMPPLQFRQEYTYRKKGKKKERKRKRERGVLKSIK